MGPDGDILDIMRVHVWPGTPEQAAILHVSDDGREISFSESDYVPFAGGAKKFTIRYDARSGRYQGCNGQDFDVVIDLGEKTKFSEVTGSFLQAASSWIYLPEAVTVSLSDDGTNFTEVGRVERPEEMREVAEVRCPFTVRGDFEARYVRVVGVNGVTPSGMKGAGQKNWLFMDEVFVQ